jgi:hypothetical protein
VAGTVAGTPAARIEGRIRDGIRPTPLAVARATLATRRDGTT